MSKPPVISLGYRLNVLCGSASHRITTERKHYILDALQAAIEKADLALNEEELFFGMAALSFIFMDIYLAQRQSEIGKRIMDKSFSKPGTPG